MPCGGGFNVVLISQEMMGNPMLLIDPEYGTLNFLRLCQKSRKSGSALPGIRIKELLEVD